MPVLMLSSRLKSVVDVNVVTSTVKSIDNIVATNDDIMVFDMISKICAISFRDEDEASENVSLYSHVQLLTIAFKVLHI